MMAALNRLERLYSRAYWLAVRAGAVRERALRTLMPARMHVVHYSWPFLPAICPCDLHLCDYLVERGVRGKAVFHFGSGGHHLVGLRNRDDRLDNDVLAITASPGEHARYVKEVVRDPALGARYKVLFGDIYNLSPAALPLFDLISLFHLGEFVEPPSSRRRLDDAGLLDLFLSKAAPGARVLFYEGSMGRRQAEPIIERAVAAGRLTFEERYKTLLAYRVVAAAP
jgi:hypothetical protein